MAVQDWMKPGIGSRRACKISTVDPANRKIEAILKDATTVQVAVFDTPGLFIWPKVGEYWTIHQREGFWMLDHRVESYDDEQKIADLQPGEGRIDADVVKTISGKNFVSIDITNIAEGASLIYSKDGWAAQSLSDALTGGADSGKSLMFLDTSTYQPKENSLITYKGSSWIPTSNVIVDSIEVTGSKLDNSFTYNTGTVTIASSNTSILTGSGGAVFNQDMVGGTITIDTITNPLTITGFDSTQPSKLQVANASGTSVSNKTYTINYGAKFATSVKIDDKASINVGDSSTINFGSFETVKFLDSSTIQLDDSQPHKTSGNTNNYQATSGTFIFGGTSSNGPSAVGRGITLDTKGHIRLYGSENQTNASSILDSALIALDNKGAITIDNDGTIDIGTRGAITVGASGNVTANNTSNLNISDGSSIFSQMISDGNIASTTSIIVKKTGTLNDTTGAGKQHARMQITGSGTTLDPWTGIIESSGRINASGEVQASTLRIGPTARVLTAGQAVVHDDLYVEGNLKVIGDVQIDNESIVTTDGSGASSTWSTVKFKNGVHSYTIWEYNRSVSGTLGSTSPTDTNYWAVSPPSGQSVTSLNYFVQFSFDNFSTNGVSKYLISSLETDTNSSPDRLLVYLYNLSTSAHGYAGQFKITAVRYL